MYSTAHYYMYVRVLHGCVLHVKACTKRALYSIYILSSCYLFRIIFSPSGRVHYVTCIGDRYMLQNLYQTKHILYQPVWLCALCNPVLGNSYMLQNLYKSRNTYYISPSGCVHYVTCIGNRYMLQTYIDTYYITYDYMIACNVHIGTYIISAHLAVCIM